jgi:alkylation response protein AidB-like acyl-CoA dehydrogenase
MNFDLSPEQKQIRDRLLKFAAESLENDTVSERDRHSVFSRGLWRRAAGAGLASLTVPTEYGGCGYDAETTTVAMEAFGHGCEDGGFVFAMGAHLFAAVVPIQAFGTAEQKSRWLPPLCDGTLVGAHAMSEPGAGSDVGGIATRAQRDGDHYVLNGVKTLATNSTEADLLLVSAVTAPDGNPQARLSSFIVETRTPGVAVTRKFETLGHRTTPLGELSLTDVRVPADALLGGKEGGGIAFFNHAMMWERVGLFAAHVGTMERMLKRTIAFARSRKQGGRPISSHQAVSHKIADMKVRLEAARLLVYKAASQLERSRLAAFDASIAKLFTSEAFVASSLDAVQILGGAGYIQGLHPAERELRDALGTTLYSGTSEIQRTIIAAWLGL